MCTRRRRRPRRHRCHCCRHAESEHILRSVTTCALALERARACVSRRRAHNSINTEKKQQHRCGPIDLKRAHTCARTRARAFSRAFATSAATSQVKSAAAAAVVGLVAVAVVAVVAGTTSAAKTENSINKISKKNQNSCLRACVRVRVCVQLMKHCHKLHVFILP